MTSGLAPHPEETLLQSREREIANTLVQLTAKAAVALRTHNRVGAVVLLAQLEETVKLTRFAEARALDDQMKATRAQQN